MSFRQIHNYMRNLTLIFCFLSAFFVAFVSPLSGQMKVGNQVFYGNEWINHAQTYHKLKVGHDGLHKINHALLSQLGLLQEDRQKELPSLKTENRFRCISLLPINWEIRILSCFMAKKTPLS